MLSYSPPPGRSPAWSSWCLLVTSDACAFQKPTQLRATLEHLSIDTLLRIHSLAKIHSFCPASVGGGGCLASCALQTCLRKNLAARHYSSPFHHILSWAVSSYEIVCPVALSMWVRRLSPQPSVAALPPQPSGVRFAVAQSPHRFPPLCVFPWKDDSSSHAGLSAATHRLLAYLVVCFTKHDHSSPSAGNNFATLCVMRTWESAVLAVPAPASVLCPPPMT